MSAYPPLRLAEEPGPRRPKPRSAWVSQGVWVLVGIAGAIVFSGETHRALAVAVPLVALGSILWIEWFERCEDRRKANTVFGAIMVVLALILVRNRASRTNGEQR